VTGLNTGVVNVFSSDLTRTNTFAAQSSLINKVIYINGYILTASNDRTVKIWNPSDWSLYGTYTAHTASVFSLTSLSNTVMASGEGDGVLRQWTLTSGSFLTTSVVYSTGGTCCGGATFTFSEILDVCYIPSLNRIFVALYNGNIQFFNKDTDAITGQLSSYTSNGVYYGHTAGSRVLALALVDNTNVYLASGGSDNKVIIWDVPSYSVR
jgi:WD40 repeat protein